MKKRVDWVFDTDGVKDMLDRVDDEGGEAGVPDTEPVTFGDLRTMLGCLIDNLHADLKDIMERIERIE